MLKGGGFPFNIALIQHNVFVAFVQCIPCICTMYSLHLYNVFVVFVQCICCIVKVFVEAGKVGLAGPVKGGKMSL